MSRCLVFVMTISFLGCATLTPQTAAIMTPHELCLKYVGNNKNNARTAYAELNRRGIACDVAAYQQLRRQKDAEWWANFRKLQRHVNCLETGIPNISINQLKTSTPYLRCADVTRCNIMAYTYQAGSSISRGVTCF